MIEDDGAEEYEKAIQLLQEERRKVIAGECPDCGSNLIKERDDRISGPTSVEGIWHRVTCSSCKYWSDWCIPDVDSARSFVAALDPDLVWLRDYLSGLLAPGNGK